ncbi:MAG: hypothetical protein QM708_10135 [Propioniciclava sp.]|uniref:hypothetical protein n=1 Tax=Propioniciclava sp. TaxID=2038686 RepID=UPI0039E366BA
MSEQNPSPDEARRLLEQAGQLGAAAQSGASWPQIALLLGLGGVSSMAVIAIWLVLLVDVRLLFIPMLAMLAWTGILLTVTIVFTRATKAGFGRRWLRAMLIWGLTWTFCMIGGAVWWKGEIWFTVASALALTLVTVVPAWKEARQ